MVVVVVTSIWTTVNRLAVIVTLGCDLHSVICLWSKSERETYRKRDRETAIYHLLNPHVTSNHKFQPWPLDFDRHSISINANRRKEASSPSQPSNRLTTSQSLTYARNCHSPRNLLIIARGICCVDHDMAIAQVERNELSRIRNGSKRMHLAAITTMIVKHSSIFRCGRLF